MKKTYYFGSKSRITKQLDLKNARKINLINVFFISSADRIIYVKAWSILIVFFLIFKKRPVIIQIADGLITESNCSKEINSKPHLLYQRIYGDHLLINQSVSSIPSFIDEKFVATNVEYQLEEKIVGFNELVLVFGNDPFVEKDEIKIKKEIQTILKKLPTFVNIAASSPSNYIKNIINEISPEINISKKFRLSDYPNEDILFVSTPSTVGHDLLLQNRNVLSLGSYDCHTMKYLFNDSEKIEFSNGVLKAKVKKLASKTLIKYDMDSIVKNNCKTSFFDLISTLSFRRLASDLKSLIS